MTKKLAAEFIGTFTLVLLGCGAAVLAGFGTIGQEGIAWAFGLAIVAMAYGIGPVSGCHVNPAVSFGAWVAGRMPTGEMLGYWVAQCLGAIVGAGVLFIIASGGPDYSLAEGPGQNGYGVRGAVSNPGSPGDYSLPSAALFEGGATSLLALLILGVTPPNAAPHTNGAANKAMEKRKKPFTTRPAQDDPGGSRPAVRLASPSRLQ